MVYIVAATVQHEQSLLVTMVRASTVGMLEESLNFASEVEMLPLNVIRSAN